MCNFSKATTPVFSVTWSFRNHSNILIDSVPKKYVLLACWKKIAAYYFCGICDVYIFFQNA